MINHEGKRLRGRNGIKHLERNELRWASGKGMSATRASLTARGGACAPPQNPAQGVTIFQIETLPGMGGA